MTLPLADLKSPDLVKALALWDSWRGDGIAPLWDKIELSRFPPPLLPMTTVVDVLEGGRDYRYRYWGSELTRLFKRDETGNLLSLHSVTQSSDIRFHQFGAVVAEMRPVLFMTIFEKFEGVMAEKLNLRLPTIDGQGQVDKIISLSTLERVGMHSYDDLSEFLYGKTVG
ncbi:MAG: hypothetical protein RIB80_04240 [Rhodospirillales bacterium]